MRRSARTQFICMLTGATGAIVFTPVGAAIPPALIRAVPADHLAAVLVDDTQSETANAAAGEAGTRAGSLLDSAATVIAQLRGAGVLVQRAGPGGVVLDALTSASVLRQYPYAIVVTGAGAQRLPGGRARLSDLQGAVIVRTGGDHAPIRRQIQSLLTVRTDETNSRIVRSSLFGQPVYTLTDRRLPPWAIVQWGAFGDYYVIGLGREGFTDAVGAVQTDHTSVAADPWFADAHRRTDGRYAHLEISLRLDRIRESLAAVISQRVDGTIGQLGLGGVQRGLWSIGRDGRAVTATVAVKRPRRTIVTPIARGLTDGDPVSVLIPDAARSYAIIEHPPAKLVRRVRGAILASRSARAQTALHAAWNRMAKPAGLDIERDLLAHLGDRIIIHNDPPHPLGIPLLVTIVVPIDESAERVKRSMNILLAACADWLTPPAPNRGGPFAVRLKRTDDDIWYIQAGIVGPAVSVEDNNLVISFSPTAVRQVLKTLAASREPQSADHP